jgi:hypothetical protein
MTWGSSTRTPAPIVISFFTTNNRELYADLEDRIGRTARIIVDYFDGYVEDRQSHPRQRFGDSGYGFCYNGRQIGCTTGRSCHGDDYR